MIYQRSTFERYSDKPIIQPKDFPGAECIFNCGQTIFEGQPLLLVSILHVSGHYRGIKGATTHVARTTDGIHFEIDPEPFLQRREDFPFGSYDIENHPIDTRITQIGDTYYVVHPASGQWGTFGILGKTKDFKKHDYIDIISLPDNRVPCLFPEKINGMYWRLDRPYRVAPNNNHSLGNIWLSESPDLIFWGRHRPLLQAGIATWGQEKIGPTPPIKTEKGWLTIIHGVSSSCAGRRYALGAMMLDLDDPSKVIGYTTNYLLAPDVIYEQVGRVPNVVFSCGAIADYEKRLIRLYYGCADTSIGLATADLDEVIDLCIAN
jgi:beta-1,4-mannooligosaccharide/beta-1,4-mannosyl-N-acetylglucosamine phosphorylase